MTRQRAPKPAAQRSTRSRSGGSGRAPIDAETDAEPVLRSTGVQAERRPKRAAAPTIAPASTAARATATDTKDIQQRATSALICYYHPAVDRSTLKQKQQWAEFFGTTKQRLAFWENRLAEAIGTFRRGAVPLPAAPDGKEIPLKSANGVQQASVQLTALHGYDLQQLKASLLAKCHRPLDHVPYGAHGLWGMYREGFKWAVTEILSGKMDASGRKAAAVLKAVGVKINATTIYYGARVHLDEERTVVRSPLKPSSGHLILPVEFIEKLRNWVGALRAMNIKVGSSMVLGAVNVTVKGHPIADQFKHGEARRDWYKRFKRMCAFPKQVKPKRIELSRAKWCTSKNIAM
mmetsp:Transcript_6048/g.15840  ORF Transcript_6048/g.15840 Transcript_6048/m.15840 type:complete len:348 (+) Transcript_6048:115-1158(+)